MNPNEHISFNSSWYKYYHNYFGKFLTSKKEINKYINKAKKMYIVKNRAKEWYLSKFWVNKSLLYSYSRDKSERHFALAVNKKGLKIKKIMYFRLISQNMFNLKKIFRFYFINRFVRFPKIKVSNIFCYGDKISHYFYKQKFGIFNLKHNSGKYLETIQPKFFFKHVEINFRIRTASILGNILNSCDIKLEASFGISFFKLMLDRVYKNL
jgi:hypothetical protein